MNKFVVMCAGRGKDCGLPATPMAVFDTDDAAQAFISKSSADTSILHIYVEEVPYMPNQANERKEQS